MSKLVLYLGSIRKGEFESLLDRGFELGIILDKNRSSYTPDLSRFKVVKEFDFDNSMDELYLLIEEINASFGIDSIINIDEVCVRHFSKIGQKFGFPALTPESAEFCLNKTLMHKCFVKKIGPESTARFSKIQAMDDLEAFAAEVGFPIILKPANLYLSMYVSKNYSVAELKENYRQMIKLIPEHFEWMGHKTKEIEIQAEEYLVGTNHSIECLSDKDGNVYVTPVLDSYTGESLFAGDFHHFVRVAPSRLDEEDHKRTTELAISGVKALGLKNAAAHVEIIYTNDGPRLVEIGGRVGGNRSRMLSLGYGIDLIYNYLQMLKGKQPDLSYQKTTPCAIVTPYARHLGTLTSFNHIDRIHGLKSYFDLELREKVGEPVGTSMEGYGPLLGIELVGSRLEEVYSDIEVLRSMNGDLFSVQ